MESSERTESEEEAAADAGAESPSGVASLERLCLSKTRCSLGAPSLAAAAVAARGRDSSILDGLDGVEDGRQSFREELEAEAKRKDIEGSGLEFKRSPLALLFH